MQKLLVPVALLATIALSSSNVLPLLSMNELKAESLGYGGQQNDNTFSNKYQSRNNLNAILFNLDVEPDDRKMPQVNFFEADNNTPEDLNSINKNENYNVKGFRKEQWHNYPRQLDRLNRYFYEHQSTDKRNLDPDDSNHFYTDESVDNLDKDIDDIQSHEYHQDTDPETRKIHNEAEVAAAVINPLLIFRIQLACLKDGEYNQLPHLQDVDIENENADKNKEGRLSNEINPESTVIKVKREGKSSLEDAEAEQKSSKNRNKRIFSLWSRLQSLNPKGHELHHRRHLYALYGAPNSQGSSGVLTAETRATFMRPPGSPLRWG